MLPMTTAVVSIGEAVCMVCWLSPFVLQYVTKYTRCAFSRALVCAKAMALLPAK